MEIQQTNQIPSQLNRFKVDEMHDINIIEWNKKRKLHGYQLDLLRPKNKCRVENVSSEGASMLNESSILESADNHTVNSRVDASSAEDRSEPESAKDSNSFIEDSDTSMSVNEEAKPDADCANAYLCVNRLSYSEEETFIDRKYNPSYDDLDTQALENPEERLLRLGTLSDHVYSEYDKDNIDQSVDKEFEDFLCSNGVNPDTYVLSSGRWDVNQEAQSSTRPPTIDQEFEEYFSALML
ncbi:protein FAR-RED-ELONGATED HYPOCOTYL 1-LIKE [Cicer arietinum]|uniref:Protein FAR-RED-ELONGATED HYPOCOTYL 1-LIKE n=1 Tax=Cicer arietinum TaxID=3827 RepID=A0A1S2Z3H1_CICAR|nr:protein FAR-RED-ELONGATED HYPOCOTYL 1-LIKE [Cicer arietinum]